MVIGYFIGKLLFFVSGEVMYLFYMGYIRLIYFSVGMVFIVVLLMWIYWVFVGNRYFCELFIVLVWCKSWWQGVWYEICWYLFLVKCSSVDIGYNFIVQVVMFGYFLMLVFMIIIGFVLYSEYSQYVIFVLFCYVVEFFYWMGGNLMDIYSWYRLGMWLIGVFVIGYVYMVLCEDIMFDDMVIFIMVNGYCSYKFGKISNKECL